MFENRLINSIAFNFTSLGFSKESGLAGKDKDQHPSQLWLDLIQLVLTQFQYDSATLKYSFFYHMLFPVHSILWLNTLPNKFIYRPVL
jgi:hypothetical protein